MRYASAVAVVLMLSVGAGARVDFVWDAQCGIGWCDCCDCGVNSKCNSWVGPASVAPICPVLPSALDDAFITGDVVVNCNTAVCRDLTQTGSLTLTPAGALGIAGTGLIDGALHWQGGALGRGGGANGQTLTVTGGVNITGTDPKTLSTFGGFTLINPGAGAWSGGDITFGQIPGGGLPAVFDNAATGVFEMQSDADILATAFGFGVLRNHGLLRKSSGGETRVAAVFENMAGAEFELLAGVFRPGAGFNNGTIDIAASAVFAVQDGALFTLQAASSIVGLGTFRVGGAGVSTAIATIDTGADISMDRIELASVGRLNGAGALTITERMDWLGGDLFDAGGLHIAPGATLAIDGPDRKNNFGRDLRIAGTATLDGDGQFDRANATILSGGLFTVRGAGGLAGGLMVNQGTVIFEPPADARYTFFTLQNAGLAEFRDHEVHFEFAQYVQSAGQTRLVNGAIRATTTLNGGFLTGVGNIFFNFTNVAGTVAPGFETTTGIINFGPGISHSFDQRADGTLRIKIAGNAPGTEHDQLLVGDVLAIGGTLDVRLLNGFLPPLGATFEIGRSGVRTQGDFHTVLSPPQRSFRAFRQAASVFVEVVARPGDMNCDGVTNFDDIEGFIAALVGPAAYEVLYPDCPYEHADANGNSLVNFDDIEAFILLLIG